MTLRDRHELMDSLRDEEYRRAYADEQVSAGLAFQIRALREDRGWTQRDLAEQTGAAQPTISQWEDPDYNGYTLKTLKRLAAAFDVALLVRLVPFSGLAEWTFGLTPQRLAPPSFEKELESEPEVRIRTTAAGDFPVGNTNTYWVYGWAHNPMLTVEGDTNDVQLLQGAGGTVTPSLIDYADYTHYPHQGTAFPSEDPLWPEKAPRKLEAANVA